MNDKTYSTVAIVGCGAVADKRHIPSFLRLKDKVNLVAVCDKNLELVTNQVMKHHTLSGFTEMTSMLREKDIDIVDVCTPPQVHADIAVKALEAGCHVLMEKPMALTVADCDKMIDAAKRNKRKLCIVHNVLFHPPLMKARELFRQGAIGDFRGMRILLADPKDEMIMRKDYWIHKLPGGLIGETGPHPVYISLAFLDNVKNVEVFAKSYLKHDWARFDEFRIELDADNGMSSIAVSYSGDRYAAEVEIFGSEGALYIDLQSMLCIKHSIKKTLNPLKLVSTSLNTTWQIKSGLLMNGFKVATGQFRVGHETVIEQFVDSVLNDTKPPVTGEEGRETVRGMEMIVERLNKKYG